MYLFNFACKTAGERVCSRMLQDVNISQKLWLHLAKKRKYIEPKIATNTREFKKLVHESDIFVDKSLLIKDFLNSSAKVILITCPRRWGKSVNMNMIKTFLEIQVDENGVKENKTFNSNHKLFQNGEIDPDAPHNNLLFPLQIAKYPEIVDKYQGNFPVIFVDFQSIKTVDYKETLNAMKLAISDSFKSHQYMIKVFKRTLYNKQSTYSKKRKAKYSLDKFKKLCFDGGKDADVTDIEDSLKFLSQILHNHFGKKVFALIDDYDRPFICNNTFMERDFSELFSLFQRIMNNMIEQNTHLEKGLITGTLQIVGEHIFSESSNVKQYNCLNNAFAAYYGFTIEEVRNLFNEFNIEHKSANIMDWYNGDDEFLNLENKIYDPYSVVNFLNTKLMQNNTIKDSSMDRIEELLGNPRIKDTVLLLLDEKSVGIDLKNLQFSRNDLLTLNQLCNGMYLETVDLKTRDLFFSYMYAEGYLTISSNETYGFTNSTFFVKLPNKRIRDELLSKLTSYFRIPLDLEEHAINELSQMIENNVNDVELTKLKEFLNFIPIKIDKAYWNDDCIHAAMISLSLKISSKININREILFRYLNGIDIIFIKPDIKLCFLMELQYNCLEDNTNESLDVARIVIDDVVTYTDIFEENKIIEAIKYVGVKVMTDKKVNIIIRETKNPCYIKNRLKVRRRLNKLFVISHRNINIRCDTPQ